MARPARGELGAGYLGRGATTPAQARRGMRAVSSMVSVDYARRSPTAASAATAAPPGGPASPPMPPSWPPAGAPQVRDALPTRKRAPSSAGRVRHLLVASRVGQEPLGAVRRAEVVSHPPMPDLDGGRGRGHRPAAHGIPPRLLERSLAHPPIVVLGGQHEPQQVTRPLDRVG